MGGGVVGSGNERIRVAYSRCNWTLTATPDVMRFASFHFAKSADESASFSMISGLSVSCIRSKIPLRYTTRNTQISIRPDKTYIFACIAYCGMWTLWSVCSNSAQFYQSVEIVTN